MSIGHKFLWPVAQLAWIHASSQSRNFMRVHQRTQQVQDDLLAELIDRHRQTAFGRDHGFASVRSWEDFKAAVPVQGYDGLRPYMERVLAGEQTAMLPADEQVLMFSMTSGTTGSPKFIPVTRRFVNEIRRGWNIFGIFAIRDHREVLLRNILQLSSPMQECSSPTGIPCGAISGLLAITQKRIVRKMYCVPTEVSSIGDAAARYYTILRCSIDKDVSIITTANPSSTIRLIETGQEHAQRLIKDIADGTYNPPGQVPVEITGLLKLRPNPLLARRLERSIAADGKLLPRHFWKPGLLTNWTGGTLKLYLPRLRELFGPQTAIRDVGLLASEGRFSIPIADDTPAGIAEITANLLEFMPLDEAHSVNPRTLRPAEVQVGQEYFLVISNWAGLWRYNIDDRVRVVGRFGLTPVFEFLSRGLHTANITGEKITEHQVVEAMRLATAKEKQAVERFVLQGRFASVPYYELRLEIRGSEAAQRLAERMDSSLQELNVEYHSKRKSGRLGRIQPILLQEGTLERVEIEKIRSRHGRVEQYKHQYLLTEVLQ